MNLVCLDSHYFKWAILERSRIGQEDMIPKAKQLLKDLDDSDATIIVPTPIITELLMEADLDQRELLLNTIAERFHIVELDVLAAKLAADVWNTKKRAGVIDQIIASGESMRTKIKVDTLILGVAMAAKVNSLYTEDKKFRTLAEGSITTRQMPDVREVQMPLL